MKLFACCVSSQKSNAIASAPIYCRAHNKEEATGLAIGYSKEMWPCPEHCNHQASALEIPEEFIRQALALP